MHILLTDILTCPRCGPSFGLILLSERMQGRRVLEGVLGCANCREQYPVRDARIDFTGEAASIATAGTAVAAAADDEEAMRLAAMMGVTEGPGYVLLAGATAPHAAAVAALLNGVEVIAASTAEEDEAAGGEASVNALRIASSLPFASARLAGVALGGRAADALLEEGARVMAPLGRLVLEPPPADAEERLATAGLRVLLRQDQTLIAGRH